MAIKSQILNTTFVALIVCMICTTSVFGQISEQDNMPLQTTDPEHEETCGNPHYLTLKGRLLEKYDSAEEFYRLPSIAHSNSFQRFSRNNASYYVSGSRQECASLQFEVNAQGGMTCPGRYVLNRDDNRVPCIMKEFKCLCNRCLIPHSLLSRRSGHACQPIYHYVPVMRRTIQLEDGSDMWSYVLEPLAVGCKCSPPRPIFSTRY